MKIVIAGAGRRPIPPTGYGGMERYIDEYASALRKGGHSVRIVNTLASGALTDPWTFARHLPGLLRGAEERIVHVNTSHAGIVLGLAGIPFVYTTHNPYWFVSRNAGQEVLWEKEALAVRFARGSVAFTDRLRERMGALRVRRGPVVTIPLGVDPERFAPHGEGSADLALGVGEISPRKNWAVAARALRGTGVRLRIVGPIRDPDLADELRRLGAELTGEVADDALRSEYARAGFLVHPSLHEALPGVVLQAMACGRPVIGSPAIASIDGVLAAPQGDDAVLGGFVRDTATRLAHDDEERAVRGLECRQIVERSYAWERVVERYLALYRQAFDLSDRVSVTGGGTAGSSDGTDVPSQRGRGDTDPVSRRSATVLAPPRALRLPRALLPRGGR